MATFKGQFCSIVLIGKQDPEIINHDFLLRKGILPIKQSPFKDLLAGKKPFTGFFWSPAFVRVEYETINIVVEQGRCQVVDNKFNTPTSSPIIALVQNYIKVLLPSTPPTLIGINFNGIFQFAGEGEEQALDARLGINKSTLATITASAEKSLQINPSVSFPWQAGRIKLDIGKQKTSPPSAGVNFNYEFASSPHSIDPVLEILNDFDKIYEKFLELLRALKTEKEG